MNLDLIIEQIGDYYKRRINSSILRLRTDIKDDDLNKILKYMWKNIPNIFLGEQINNESNKERIKILFMKVIYNLFEQDLKTFNEAQIENKGIENFIDEFYERYNNLTSSFKEFMSKKDTLSFLEKENFFFDDNACVLSDLLGNERMYPISSLLGHIAINNNNTEVLDFLQSENFIEFRKKYNIGEESLLLITLCFVQKAVSKFGKEGVYLTKLLVSYFNKEHKYFKGREYNENVGFVDGWSSIYSSILSLEWKDAKELISVFELINKKIDEANGNTERKASMQDTKLIEKMIKGKYFLSRRNEIFNGIDFKRPEFISEAIECITINIQNYRVVKKIKSGGFKQVYKAIYEKQGFEPEEVALKIYDPEKFREDNSRVEKLIALLGIDNIRRRETAISKELRHDNIAARVGFGSLEDGKFYLTEEYIDGWDLKNFIKNKVYAVHLFIERVKDMSEEQKEKAEKLIEKLVDLKEEKLLISIFDFYIIYHKVLEGLLYIQNKGYIHRDLKNDNVLVNRDLSVIKISDLQTAIRVNELSKETKGVHGSINYVAPEVILGENPSFASDVYSLGAMMYQSLTGVLPLGYSNSTEITRKRFENKTDYEATIQNVLTKIPKLFKNIVEGCLKYEPEKRTTVIELYAEFDKSARLIREAVGLR